MCACIYVYVCIFVCVQPGSTPQCYKACGGPSTSTRVRSKFCSTFTATAMVSPSTAASAAAMVTPLSCNATHCQASSLNQGDVRMTRSDELAHVFIHCNVYGAEGTKGELCSAAVLQYYYFYLCKSDMDAASVSSTKRSCPLTLTLNSGP